MPIIKITKEQMKKARKAHEQALKEFPEFRAIEEEHEKLTKEASKQQKSEKETS